MNMMYQPKIRQNNSLYSIFCDWRQKWVKLTPEEWVRQNILHLLVEDYQYPKSAIAVEQAISLNSLSKRCDAVVYDKSLQPLCIIEFKAQNIELTQKVFDQIAVYNIKLNVNYLIVSNGQLTYSCYVNDKQLTFLDSIPTYPQLLYGKTN